jgi:hypothetical protein
MRSISTKSFLTFALGVCIIKLLLLYRIIISWSSLSVTSTQSNIRKQGLGPTIGLPMTKNKSYWQDRRRQSAKPSS